MNGMHEDFLAKASAVNAALDSIGIGSYSERAEQEARSACWHVATFGDGERATMVAAARRAIERLR